MRSSRKLRGSETKRLTETGDKRGVGCYKKWQIAKDYKASVRELNARGLGLSETAPSQMHIHM